MRANYFIIAFFITIQGVRAQSPTYTQQIQEFDTYAENARQAWKSPGLAVAIIKDNKIIFSKGYGVRELGKPEVVDRQTLFLCASTTKVMTAVCMGMLVDEGKIKWDDAVVKHLPDFQLYDPYVTRELKVRDLFLHNTGVGNADFLWVKNNLTSDEILSKMKLVKPSYSMRSSFIYQNLFYLVAGKVIEKVSGQPWENFIRKRIFEPLEMTRTVPLLKEVTDLNQAKAHKLVNGKQMVIDNENADAIGPAGSVWSSIDDMGKWTLCMLDSSKYKGGRLLKLTTWKEMFKPQTIVTPEEFYPTQRLTKPNWITYGLGWFQQDYKGKKVNFHTGSLEGSVAIHGQLPEENVGIYVFGNYHSSQLRHALMYKAFDLFALGGTRDWSAEFLTLYSGLKDKEEKVQKEIAAKRVLTTKPSLSLQDYTGKYKDPLYGELEVSLVENKLTIHLNNFLKATLEHWHFDTFRATYQRAWDGTANATFVLNDLGKVVKLNFDDMQFGKVR
jgi:CubicO group peptidase (beta-lactamase class C family)